MSGSTRIRSSKRGSTSSSTSASPEVLLFRGSNLRTTIDSEKLGDVFAHLVFPIRPVVAALGAPVVERMADAFAGKYFGEAVGWSAVFPLARTGGDVNVARGDLFVEPGIAHIGEVIDGVVEIKIVVVHAVHEILHVVNAGHGKAALDDIRVLEQRICSMVRAEGSAHRGDDDAGRLAVVPDEGNDFFTQIRVKNGLDVAAMKRMRAFIVETEAIDGVDGEEFHSSGVDEIRERADHALPFELHLVAGAGGKTQQRRTVMAIDDHTELDA